jgi:O-antigen/teichoic acid export membrane protein
MDNILLHISNKVIPSWISGPFLKRFGHDGFVKYLKNTSWTVLAQVFSFAVSLLTIAYTSQYLGPENVGKISYAQSFVSILSAFTALGIDQILFREIIAAPEEKNILMGTAIVAKFFSGVLGCGVAIAVSVLLGNNTESTILVGLVALTLVIQPFSTLSVFHNAKAQARYNSYISMFVAFFIPVVKFALIYAHKGVYHFAGVLALESLLYAAYYLYTYKHYHSRGDSKFVFSKSTLYRLLSHSWPLALASLLGYLYDRIDQVMIHHYISASAVGAYSSAVKLTEMGGMLPGLIIGSLLPALMNAYKADKKIYQERFRLLLGIIMALSTVIAVFTFSLAPKLIYIIFGKDFSASVPILQLYSWVIIGITTTTLLQQHFIIEKRSKTFLTYAALGAFTNIALNLYLIPKMGASGAAIATIVSYLIIVASSFSSKSIREVIFNKNLSHES